MLSLRKSYVLVAIIAVAYLPGGRGQQQTAMCREKSIQVPAFIPCGPAGISQQEMTREVCESDSFPCCCFDDSKTTVKCFSNLACANATLANTDVATVDSAATGAKPRSFNAVAKAVQRLPDVGVTGTVAASIKTKEAESMRSFTSAIGSLVFPECAVKTPFCYRTRCNPSVANAERDPLACLSDPSCCFDRDLFIYRALFGPAYMNGAPVCYYGPTSARYRQIAGFVQPYNPFFQTTIVNIFEQYFDTALSFQEQAICVITNAISLLAKQCGWDGMTKLECNLKGCCYNSNEGACYYPSSFSQALLPNNLPIQNYPELVAEYPGENVCSATTAFSQNIYRRLPCKSPANSTTSYLTCAAIAGCCQNSLALVPGLSTITLGSSLNAATILAATGGLGISPINPFLPAINPINPFLSITNPTQLISQFFCPYIFFPVLVSGFPDLTSSTTGCCTQQVCYHIKQGSPASWSGWSQWSACSGVCGQSGQRSRTRQCAGVGGQISNTCPGASSETQPCASPPCCTYGPWRPVGSCNAACGQSGSVENIRDCFFPGSSQPCGTCVGSNRQFRPCTGVCLAQWGSWGNWGRCNAACNGEGFRTRRRTCLTNNGQISNSCPGLSTQQFSCQGPPCCSYSAWTQYSPCNAACGQTGSQTRTRRCVNSNGSPCNSCVGSPPTESISCRGSSCYRSSWSSYGPCGVDCMRERRRYCLDSNGQAVSLSLCGDSTNPIERSSCSGDACLPFSGSGVSWSNWLNWGACTVGCGGGRRTRIRICLYRGRINSPLDPQVCQCAYQQSSTYQQEETCNLQSCSPGLPGGDYSWQAWGSYTTCSSSCGSGPGTISRSRICTDGNRQQVNSGLCVGSDTESSRCEIRRPCSGQGNCNRWGNWFPARRCPNPPVSCSNGRSGWIIRCCSGSGGCSGGNRQDVTLTCPCTN